MSVGTAGQVVTTALRTVEVDFPVLTELGRGGAKGLRLMSVNPRSGVVLGDHAWDGRRDDGAHVRASSPEALPPVVPDTWEGSSSLLSTFSALHLRSVPLWRVPSSASLLSQPRCCPCFHYFPCFHCFQPP